MVIKTPAAASKCCRRHLGDPTTAEKNAHIAAYIATDIATNIAGKDETEEKEGTWQMLCYLKAVE